MDVKSEGLRKENKEKVMKYRARKRDRASAKEG